MPEYTRKKIGESLREKGYITEEQYQTALKKHQETKVPLREVLISLNYVTEEKLMEFMGVSLGIPFMKGLVNKISDPEVVKLIPEKVCRQYLAIPLLKTGGVLTVAMADPLDVFAIDDLESLSKCTIEPVFGKKNEILKTIEILYEQKGMLEEIVKGATDEFDEGEENFEIIRDGSDEEVSEEAIGVEDAPIIRLVNTIIAQAIKERASDIHVEPDEKNFRIRYRVDGVLREAMMPPRRLQAAITSRIKIMAGMDISIKRTPQDGRFKMRAENKDFDVRISSVPTIYGEKIVMRLLDQGSIKVGLEEIGFNEECLNRFKELIERPYGIVLVTGPTGSGKTTTLYLALQSINSPDKNIITIEEPVEYDLEGINQIAVNIKAGVTFAKGLRSILRQDPDVIMVGEMRDLETADVAVRAALTGHLVFSTLHTNDAASSIVRLVDMGIPPYLVTSSVCGVLAQRLVRMICPECKEAYHPAAHVLADAGLEENTQEYRFFRGKGCDACGGTGYSGRTGVLELMTIDRELRSLIHAGKSSDVIRASAQSAGMKVLWEDGLEKVLKGITTMEEINKVAFIEQE